MRGALKTQEKLYIRPIEASRILGLSAGTVYKYLHDGVIPSRKLGCRYLIPIKEAEETLNVKLTGRDDSENVVGGSSD